MTGIKGLLSVWYDDVMHRTRNEENLTGLTRHGAPHEFLNTPVTNGFHTVKLGTENLDFLVVNRGAPVTLVMFHSALTNRTRTTPAFQGQGVAEDAGMNLVAVSDPSLELGDIDLAWYLGNRRTGPLRPILSPLIQHCIEQIGSERVVLFGASGGGYAAINFGQDFPGSIVLAVNPRLDLSARPEADMGTYLNVCHGAVSATPQRRIRAEFATDRLAECFTGNGLPFDLLLFQNTGDWVYRAFQARPFIDQLHNDARLYTRMEYTAEGHKPIPGDTIREILDALASPHQDRHAAIKKAGFTHHTATASVR